MNIVYVTYEFPGEMPAGGLATYINNISAIMREYGHHVTVLTLSEKQSREYILENGVKVIAVKRYLYEGKLWRKQKSRMETLVNAWHLHQIICDYEKSHRIDIVQATNIYGVGLFRTKAPTVIRLSSDSIIVREAGKFIFDLKQSDKKLLFEDWLEYITEKQADAVFAPGNITASIVSKRTNRPVAVIESPFYMEDLKEEREIYDKRLSGKKYFLTHGSMQNLKGTKVVAESLHMLLNKYRDIYFVFAGVDYQINKNGTTISAVNYLKRSAKEYANRVIYLGVLSKNQLTPVIQGAMACILPSRIENLSNACIEAMGLGKVVIATANAGFGQLIIHKKSGILFKRDSAAALERAVDYFMHMDNVQKEEMEYMAQEILERLNSEHCYQRLIGLYENIMKEMNRRFK